MILSFKHYELDARNKQEILNFVAGSYCCQFDNLELRNRIVFPSLAGLVSADPGSFILKFQKEDGFNIIILSPKQFEFLYPKEHFDYLYMLDPTEGTEECSQP